MDITLMVLMVLGTERDLPMLRLRLRLSQRHSMVIMVTLTVWATTLAMLDMAMLVTHSLMAMESPPPTLPSDTPWPTLPVESPTPPTLVFAPTTSEPLSLARQSAPLSQHEFLLNLLNS